MTSRVIEGKTKIITPAFNDPTAVLITTKNSLTGNDGLLQENLPLAFDKTEQTCNVFRLLEKTGIPTAFVKQTSETTFLASACAMLPLECVTRRIPYGSYLKRHPRAASVSRWKNPMVEFFHKHAVVMSKPPSLLPEAEAREKYMGQDYTTYYDVYTDPLIIQGPVGWKWRLHPAKEPFSRDGTLLSIPPVANRGTMRDIKELMLSTFQALEAAWEDLGVTLVDLKIEVGKCSVQNRLVVADVIDNDSWRIWPGNDPTKQLDKQAFREGATAPSVLENYAKVTELTRQWTKAADNEEDAEL